MLCWCNYRPTIVQLYSRRFIDAAAQFYIPKNSVDFHTGMGKNPIQFGLIDPQDKKWFAFFKSTYDRYNFFNQIAPDAVARIPKIIHQIWLGSPVPERYKEWMNSWRIHNPEWLYILWTDETVAYLKLYNQELYNKARNYGQKSDILRYELLYKFGGLYVDIDFRCLKPFDIFHHCYDFYIGLLNGGGSEVAIGLIRSIPEHPVLKTVITSMHTVNSDDAEQVLETTGNYHFLRSFMSVAPYDTSRLITFPCNFFYPSPNSERFLTPQEQDAWITPESFAIHYWSCSWQKPEAAVKYMAYYYSREYMYE